MSRDPWAPREDGLSSIDIPDGPPPGETAAPADVASPPLPPGHSLGPNIHSALVFGEARGRPREAHCEAPEYVVFQDLPRIAPAPVDWLWPGRIPLGKLTLLVGDPGVGKSLVALDMAARVSRGAAWPDAPDVKQKRGHVLILAAEDAPHDTLVPRLVAMAADLRLVESAAFLQGSDRSGWREKKWNRPIVLPDDIGLLEVLVAPRYEKPYVQKYYTPEGQLRDGETVYPEDGPFPPTRLIVVDPLTAYFAQAGGNDNVQVRKLLQPLVEFAARFEVAVVGIMHLNKSTSQPGQYRALGSQAFTAVARAVWGVAKSRRDPARRLLLPVKNNLGPAPAGLSFGIENGGVVWGADPPEDDWSSTIDRRAEKEERRKLTTEEATVWLRELLQDGDMRSVDVIEMATKERISVDVLYDAKSRLQVESHKQGFQIGSHWTWSLPK